MKHHDLHHAFVATERVTPTPAFRRHMREVEIMRYIRTEIKNRGTAVACEISRIKHCDAYELAQRCKASLDAKQETYLSRCEHLMENDEFFSLVKLLLRK